MYQNNDNDAENKQHELQQIEREIEGVVVDMYQIISLMLKLISSGRFAEVSVHIIALTTLEEDLKILIERRDSLARY